MEYLLKASAVIAIFYLCYKLFLQRDTFFESNRGFLLLGLITAFTIPFVVIPIYIEYTPTAIPHYDVSSGFNVLENSEKPLSIFEYIPFVYLVGIFIFTLRFLFQVTSLSSIIIKNKGEKHGPFNLIKTHNTASPFSFFNWIVYNPNQFNNTELEQIITHEKIHARQYHSIDILLTQLACILLWFNPFIWFYNKSLKQNLEFIADQNAQSKSACNKSYQHTLLKTSMPIHQLALSNNFYNSLIKKRIVMLQKSKSKKRNLLKYALVLPFLALFLMSFNTEEVYVAKTLESNNSTDSKEQLLNNLDLIEINSENKYDLTEIEKEETPIKNNNTTHKINNSEISISGKVINNEGKGLPGANVVVKGNTKSTITDFDGNYSIKVSIEDILIFSYLGMLSKEVIVTNKDKINVTLKPGITSNKITEKALLIIDGKEAKDKKIKDLDQDAIESVSVFNGREKLLYNKYGEKAKYGVIIITTKNSSKDQKTKTMKTISDIIDTGYRIFDEKHYPIYIIDDKEVKIEVFEKLQPDDIESLIVLKGEKAIKKYGNKGKEGVIEITTKKKK